MDRVLRKLEAECNSDSVKKFVAKYESFVRVTGRKMSEEFFHERFVRLIKMGELNREQVNNILREYKRLLASEADENRRKVLCDWIQDIKTVYLQTQYTEVDPPELE